MKGLVIKNGEKYYTFLKKLFISINDIQTNYNWLITGHECYPQNDKYTKMLSAKYCWMTGDELTKMIEDEDFQWIWGMFLAFPKDISQQSVLKYGLPKANGYEGIWKNPITILHPYAEIEIVAWDSSMTIFISKKDEIVELLQRNNTFALDLQEYNQL